MCTFCSQSTITEDKFAVLDSFQKMLTYITFFEFHSNPGKQAWHMLLSLFYRQETETQTS